MKKQVKDYCVFWGVNRKCGLNEDVKCAYSLTEIKIPKKCPLPITISIERKRGKKALDVIILTPQAKGGSSEII